MNKYLTFFLFIIIGTSIYYLPSSPIKNKNEKVSLSDSIQAPGSHPIKTNNKRVSSLEKPQTDENFTHFSKMTEKELQSYKAEIDQKLKESMLLIKANEQILTSIEKADLRRLLKNYGLASEAEINLILDTK